MMRVFLSLFYFAIFCQSFLFANDIKKEMRIGNKAFIRKDYATAELNYRKALDSIASALDVQYNLGCALYMQVDSTNVSSDIGKERLENAEKYFNNSGEKFLDKELKEASFFNLGNTYLKQGDFDKAIESYKKSLRINPNNFSTKENLYYAQLLKQQNQNQDKNQNKKDDQDKDQDNKKDQQQNQIQDKNNQDKKQDKKDDQNQDQQENQNEKQQNQQPQNISKDDAERILNALQQQENQTQENLEKQKAKPIRANSGKNW